MSKLIIDKKITESPFSVVDDLADMDKPNVIVPLKAYREHLAKLSGRDDVGVWLDADEEIEDVAADLERLPVVALNFPTFFDGRSLSNANILRRKLGYRGEVRAIGDVRRDQLDQMQRCGINAFQMAEGQDLEKALESLDGFTYVYQSSVDRPEPLFRSHRHH